MAAAVSARLYKRYDHPAYDVRLPFSAGVNVAGASALTAKFAAFTAMKLKSVLFSVITKSTAAGSTPLIYTKSGTTTSTTTLTALTSGSDAAEQYTLATAISLAAGDSFWATHGTDATAVYSTTFECQLDAGGGATVG